MFHLDVDTYNRIKTYDQKKQKSIIPRLIQDIDDPDTASNTAEVQSATHSHSRIIGKRAQYSKAKKEEETPKFEMLKEEGEYLNFSA